jgi:hypothetical protein
MDSKTLIKALKVAVREVIKEELTEILREGLQSTITEMQQPVQKQAPQPKLTKRPKVQFAENRWADILNETDALIEQGSAGTSFSDLVNEGMDEIRMTSRDAQNFGQMRQNMRAAISGEPMAPSVMEDPETGKTYDVAPEVAQAMTRDYSALMKAMNKKKGG